MKKLFYTSVLAIIMMIFVGTQQKTFAVTNCGGFYSPNNPFPCNNGGNCVWWTWHWLRHGKGHRDLSDTRINKLKRSALYWDDDATTMGLTVNGTPGKGAVAVNETQRLSDGTTTGHVGVVADFDDTYLYIDEMNWGSYGLTQRKRYRRSSGYFTKFIHPFSQPKLTSIVPDPIYRATYDQNAIVFGENLNLVRRIELTFPNGQIGTLSGSQIVDSSTGHLSFLATFGTRGRYVINVVTDKNVEAIPQMPFNVR